MATTSELTDTSLNIAGTTTINGIESTLSNNSSKVATSSAILTAINNSASNVSSYVDSAISNIKWGTYATSLDCDTLLETGTYLAESFTNGPEGDYGTVVVYNGQGTWIIQLFFRILGTHPSYYRICNVGTWTTWTKIAAKPLQLVLSNNTTWCDIYDQFAYMASGVLTFGARVTFKGTPGTWVDLLSINTYVNTPIDIYFDVCSRNGRPVSLYFSNNQDSHTKLISGQQFVVNDEIRFTLTVPILS